MAQYAQPFDCISYRLTGIYYPLLKVCTRYLYLMDHRSTDYVSMNHMISPAGCSKDQLYHRNCLLQLY